MYIITMCKMSWTYMSEIMLGRCSVCHEVQNVLWVLNGVTTVATVSLIESSLLIPWQFQ